MQKQYKAREKKAAADADWESPRRNPGRAVRSGVKAPTALHFSDDELNSDDDDDGDKRDHTWTSVSVTTDLRCLIVFVFQIVECQGVILKLLTLFTSYTPDVHSFAWVSFIAHWVPCNTIMNNSVTGHSVYNKRKIVQARNQIFIHWIWTFNG